MDQAENAGQGAEQWMRLGQGRESKAEQWTMQGQAKVTLTAGTEIQAPGGKPPSLTWPPLGSEGGASTPAVRRIS